LSYFSTVDDATVEHICRDILESGAGGLADLARVVRVNRRVYRICQPLLRKAREARFPPEGCSLKYHLQEQNRIGCRIECGDLFALLSVSRNRQCVRGALESLFPLLTESGSARMFHPALQRGPPMTLNPALPNSALIEAVPPDFEWLGNLLYNCMEREWRADARPRYPGKSGAEVGLAEFCVAFFPARRR
jgi:hypothetical protein